jgi:hypothetical protein
MKSQLFCVALPVLSSCLGTTGGEVVAFDAAASGSSQVAGAPFEFDNDLGWHVSLTTAKLHVGAVYLNRVRPGSGVGNVPCILGPGTYVAEVVEGMDVDLLSPVPQPFPVHGDGSTLPALTAQLWLTHVPIDVVADNSPILRLEGSAELNGDARPFTASITIASNRIGTINAQAGAKTICTERIVTVILPAALSLQTTGHLLLRVDPTLLFTNVRFDTLPAADVGYAFSNGDAVSGTDANQASHNLYQNLKQATSGLYSLEWIP